MFFFLLSLQSLVCIFRLQHICIWASHISNVRVASGYHNGQCSSRTPVPISANPWMGHHSPFLTHFPPPTANTANLPLFLSMSWFCDLTLLNCFWDIHYQLISYSASDLKPFANADSSTSDFSSMFFHLPIEGCSSLTWVLVQLFCPCLTCPE